MEDISDTELEDDLQALTVTELHTFMLSTAARYTTEAKSTKTNRIHAIIARNPIEVIRPLQEKGHQVRLSKLSKHKKRLREYEEERRIRRRLEPPQVAYTHPSPSYDTAHFLDLPSEDERKACFREFYEATSNEAVQLATCGVCARWLMKRKSRITTIPLSAVPHPERLRPKSELEHPAQVLTHGMLLDSSAITSDDDGRPSEVNVCGECLDGLKKENTTAPPKYSLANNLWIGEIPWELRRLTVPEQLLIALLYPRVFVFKMWPKKAEGIRAENTQRGMRGTVSTYEQDIRGIAAMTQGKLMPRPPSILSSIITVTFIAKGRLPKSWLYNTFRVRRHAVRAALIWLKTNNTKYYGDIEISDTHLQQLPEDGVPEEIIANVHQSEDVGIVDQESEGYVPREEEGPDHGERFVCGHLYIVSCLSDEPLPFQQDGYTFVSDPEGDVDGESEFTPRHSVSTI